MSWHYSQVLVEEFWEENCLVGEQSVQSNKTPTASLHLPKDRMKDFSRLSQFGMTFAPLMESLGEELLMWFLEGFHVQTSQLLEKGLESREKKVASGQRWQGLLAKYDPDLHLLKTAQCSLLEDSTQYSVTLPKWGLMQSGDVFQQPKSEQITKGIESGLSQKTWPTPTTQEIEHPNAILTKSGRRKSKDGKSSHSLNLADTVKMWPTPTTDIGHERSKEYWVKRVGKHQIDLQGAVKMWPTPDANMAARGTQENWTKTRPSGHQAQYTINQAVRDSLKMWPTPTATEARQGYQDRTRGKKGSQKSLSTEVIDNLGGRQKTGGQLNPTWVEWLMGWPLGWTDLKPLEMGKYQKWLELHGRY